MKSKLLLTALACGTSLLSFAQDPIIQTKYTADPAPMVHDGTAYLYTTHDEDDADGFKMLDWLLYSSTDMVNWTDHGAVASLKDFKWIDKTNGAWAEQVVYRNGKYYMYCPIHGNGIGVLVSDTPYGPFKDPLGHALVWQKEHWNDIDPTVWIDDDGQAYMYWGNPILYHIKLNEDMISTSGEIVAHPHIEDYQEGPWFYKRNGHYYLAFASTCCPEGIGYAMSDSPEGPWEYKGHIMNHTPRTRGNHPGIIDFEGKSYVFGLNYDLLRIETQKHHERRSVSYAEMHYNADGTIQEVPYFKDNVNKQLHWVNPFKRVEAETMAWGYGLKTGVNAKLAQGAKPGVFVTNIDDDETLLVKGVDFGKGAKKFYASIASVKKAEIEVRIDSKDGPKIAELKIKSTGGKDVYKLMQAKVKKVAGVHDLYFCFDDADQGDKDLFNFDFWYFK